jgi:hypothetical protein
MTWDILRGTGSARPMPFLFPYGIVPKVYLVLQEKYS